MRCDYLCCIMSRDTTRCPVMCVHVMCPAMVTLCVRNGSVTSLYYKVLLQYYSVAPRIVNDVSYATDINHVNDGSYVSRINHECCFVVQSSTGVVRCSTV